MVRPWLFLATVFLSAIARADTWIPAGAARVDISPSQSVRMMGYASRKSESEGVAQPIHARALALGDGTNAAVLITADNCILPGWITEEVRRRLGAKAGIAPERVVLSVSHTHSAPCLLGAAPNIFVSEISAAETNRIAAYTDFFVNRVEEVALAALDARDRKSTRLNSSHT